MGRAGTTGASNGRLWDGVKFVAALVVLLWVLEGLDLALGGALDRHGLRPRELAGLEGIVFAPFLHGGFGHLASNTVPFAVLGSLVMTRGMRAFLLTTATIVLLGGALTWLFGRSANHIGASGLVFGWLGFLLVAGLVERSLASIAIAVVVGFLYGGLLWGVLPSDPRISWEGHLFGAVAGAAAARGLSRKPATRPP